MTIENVGSKNYMAGVLMCMKASVAHLSTQLFISHGLSRVVLDVIHYSIQLQFLCFAKIACVLSSSIC